MVLFDHLPLYSLALSLANRNGADAAHENAALPNHRSVPEISSNIDYLHQALQVARAVAEDQDGTVQVTGQGLQDVLDKIKALEDQVSAMLPSKASSPPSSMPETSKDIPNELDDGGCSSPLSGRATDDVSGHFLFRRNANCIAGASNAAQGQDQTPSENQDQSKNQSEKPDQSEKPSQTEKPDVTSAPSHEAGNESPLSENPAASTLVSSDTSAPSHEAGSESPLPESPTSSTLASSDSPTSKDHVLSIMATTTTHGFPSVSTLFKEVPVESDTSDTTTAGPVSLPYHTILSFVASDPVTMSDALIDSSTSTLTSTLTSTPISTPPKSAAPVFNENYTTLTFTSTTRRTETVTRMQTKTISLARPTGFVRVTMSGDGESRDTNVDSTQMTTDERAPTTGIESETLTLLPYYANATSSASRTALALEETETQPSNSVLPDPTTEGAQLALPTLSKREYRLSLPAASSGFMTVSTPRSARPKRYY